MSMAISLYRLGAYVLDEIERGMTIATRDAKEESVRLHSVEVCIAYATMDGSPASPTITVGEVPISPQNARRALEELTQLVYVDLDELQKAHKGSVGKLILRVVFPTQPDEQQEGTPANE